MEKLKPMLKWAGGKSWLVPVLEGLYQPYQNLRLVEPFAGGLSVSLSLRPKRALLNDINPHLINLYRWVKRGLENDLPMEYRKDMYYKYRNRFNELIKSGKSDTKEAALLFYYLNRTGYNGLCRFNRRGEFNVPFGKYKTVRYERDFSKYQEAFSEWEFVSGDFRRLDLKPDDFVYADPPYDHTFTSYSEMGFSWKDQVGLAEWLSSHPGPVVASNSATERILSLYQSLGFEVWLVKAPRRISCDGDRAPATEMLALKNIGASFLGSDVGLDSPLLPLHPKTHTVPEPIEVVWVPVRKSCFEKQPKFS